MSQYTYGIEVLYYILVVFQLIRDIDFHSMFFEPLFLLCVFQILQFHLVHLDRK